MSALQLVAIKILDEEVVAKEKKVQCRVVLWDNIKYNPPEVLKVSPITMIPHKSRIFQAIMDLSFALRQKMATSFHR